eukprot:279232_1
MLLFLCLLHVASGELRLNGVFGDHMVLQTPDNNANIPASRIYGMALLTETIYISGSAGFPGPFKVTPKTNIQNSLYGNWSVEIVPNENDKSYPGPYTITINISNTTIGRTLNDVYFGDVFLCGGQSNMQVTIDETDDAASEKKAANSLPNIRINQIKGNYSNSTIQNISSSIPWTVSSNNTIGRFSAVCWVGFGRLISEYLSSKTGKTNYIGLIESAVGGTTVHFWAPGIVGQSCNSTGQLPWQGECANGNSPGALFNAMINPISMNGTGLSIRAVSYYQGEADSGENDIMTQRAYRCELMGMINQWRVEFKQPMLPFINVQLPPLGQFRPYTDIDGTWEIPDYNGWQAIQIAQYNVFKLVNNTGLVTTMDQGQGQLHYPHKIDVATRVAQWTKYLAFNDLTINAGAPMFMSAFKKESSSLSVYIEVMNVGKNGLQLKPSQNCTDMKPEQVYTTNATNISCCAMGGANVVTMRLEGIFFTNDWTTNYNDFPMIWNWVPANVTFINNNDNTGYIIATPILPQRGCYGWPRTISNWSYTKTISITKIAVGVEQQCAIINSDNGVPLSISGPYEIGIDPIKAQIVEQKLLQNKLEL